MKRGEIWTLAGGGEFSRKPRPVVIVQADEFAELESITFCPLTTNPREAPLFRVAVEPDEASGLRQRSSVMVDKISSVRKSRLGTHIGNLNDGDVVRLNRALAVFVGLAGSSIQPGS